MRSFSKEIYKYRTSPKFNESSDVCKAIDSFLSFAAYALNDNTLNPYWSLMERDDIDSFLLLCARYKSYPMGSRHARIKKMREIASLHKDLIWSYLLQFPIYQKIPKFYDSNHISLLNVFLRVIYDLAHPFTIYPKLWGNAKDIANCKEFLNYFHKAVDELISLAEKEGAFITDVGVSPAFRSSDFTETMRKSVVAKLDFAVS